MNFRPNTSLYCSAFLLAAISYVVVSAPAGPGICAQETTVEANHASERVIHDKIELQEIRLAIRLQEVAVAKAERHLLAPTSARAAETREAAEQQLAAMDDELSRLKKLHKEKLVSDLKVEAAMQKRRSAEAKLAEYQSEVAARNGKLKLHDERIELLELRAKLCEARLNQLRRKSQP